MRPGAARGSSAVRRAAHEPAIWALPASLVLGYLAATSDVEQSPGYPLAAAIRGHGALLVLVPVVAATCAWKAGRYRRAGWTAPIWARSAHRVLGAEVLTSVSVQVLAYVVLRMAIAGGLQPAWSWDVRLAGVAVALLAGWASAGFMVGWFLRAEVAVPAVLVAAYSCSVLPIAVEPLWVRHATGLYLGCCSQDSVLDSGAVRAPVLVCIGLISAAALALRPWHRIVRIVGAALALLVGVAGAAASVHHLGPDPTTPRSGAVQCKGRAPQVCLWPEQRDALDSVVALASGAVHRWRQAGFVVPSRFSSRPLVAGSVATVDIPPHPSRDEVLRAITTGVVPISVTCPKRRNDTIEGDRDLEWAVMAIDAGVSQARVLDEIGTWRSSDLGKLLRLDARGQRRWVALVERATRNCGPGPMVPAP